MKNYEVEVAINDFTTIGSNVAISLANLPFSIRYRQRCSRQSVMQCHDQLSNMNDSESLTSVLWLKKKSKVVQCGLYPHRQRYSSSQWSKFVLDSRGVIK